MNRVALRTRALAASACTLVLLAVAPAVDAQAQTAPAPAGWTPVAPTLVPRGGPASVALADGRVLVTGGRGATAAAGGGEIYDAATDRWQATSGSVEEHRGRHRSLLLADGRVLLLGGHDTHPAQGAAVLYDPARDTWEQVPAPPVDGDHWTAARLPDGTVLTVTAAAQEPAAAMVLDPATVQWRQTAAPQCSGGRPELASLGDGRVLVAGSCAPQVFDAGSGAWTPTAAPGQPLTGVPVTLPSGDVLVTGQLLRHRAGDWRTTGTAPEIGRLTVAGGVAVGLAAAGLAVVYDPATDLWRRLAHPSGLSTEAAVAELPDGSALVVGSGRSWRWLPPTGAGAPTDTGPASVLRVAPQKHGVPAGQPVPLTAVLSTVDGRPQGDEPVELYQRAGGLHTGDLAGWSRVAAGRTDVDGVVRFAPTPANAEETTWAVRHPATATSRQAASADLTVGPQAAATVPGAPERVLVDVGDSAGEVRGLPPATAEGGPVTGYHVSTQPATRTVTTGPDDRVVRLPGLQNGISYVVSITALGAAGAGGTASQALIPRAGARLPEYDGLPGTPRCGRLPAGEVRWSGANVVCPLGVIVGAATSLVLDAGSGPVDVAFTGLHGLDVVDGVVRTAATSATRTATLRATGGGRPRWRGVDASGPLATLQLHHAAVSGATTGISLSEALRLDLADVVVSDSLDIGVHATAARTTAARVRVAGTYFDEGMVVSCPFGRRDCHVDLDQVAVDRAAGTGLVLNTGADVRTTGTRITRSGLAGLRSPAAQVTATGSLQPGGNLGPVSGGGNGIDAVALAVTSTADLDWVTPQRRDAASDEPLGYLLRGVRMTPGTSFRAPPGATVHSTGCSVGTSCGRSFGTLELDRARLSTTGVLFTSTADVSAAPVDLPLCPSAVARECAARPGTWGGVVAKDGAVVELVGSTVRYAVDGVSSTGDATISVAGSTFTDNERGIGTVEDTTVPTTGRVSVTGSTFSSTAGGHLAVQTARTDSTTVTDSTLRGTSVLVHGRRQGQGSAAASCTGSTVRLERLVVEAARSGALTLVDACRPVVRDNLLRDDGAPALRDRLLRSISLQRSVVTVGPGRDVSGNLAAGSQAHATALEGSTVLDGLDWVTPGRSEDPRPLGLVATGFSVLGPGQLRVPAGGELTATRVALRGADLSVGPGARLRAPTQTPDAQLCGPCPEIHLTGPVGSQDDDPGWSGAAGSALLTDVVAPTATLTVDDDTADPRAQVQVTGSTLGGPLTVNGAALTRVEDSTVDGILVSRSSRTVLQRNTVPRSATHGISVTGAADGTHSAVTDLVVADNVVRSSAATALRLSRVRTTIGPLGAVRGNQGEQAGAYALLHVAVVDGGLTWVDPSGTSGRAPLGLVAGTRNGDLGHLPALTVTGPQPLVLPAGSTVKATRIDLVGAALDATAGGSTVTGVEDDTVGVPTCRALVTVGHGTCGHGPDAGADVRVLPGPGGVAGGGAGLVQAELRGTLAVSSGATSAPGEAVHGVLVRDSLVHALDSSGTRTLVERSVVSRGATLTGGSGHVLRDVHLQSDLGRSGLAVDGASATLTRATVTRTPPAVAATGRPGIAVTGASDLRVECTSVRGSNGGIRAAGGTVDLRDVDLTGNRADGTAFDLDNTVLVRATGVWWGQVGGPVPGQVRDSARLLRLADAAAPVPCARPATAVVAAPEAVTATPTATGLVARWQPGSPGTTSGYRVAAEPGGRTVTVPAGALQAVVDGLPAGVPHALVVTALGSGASSVPVRTGSTTVSGGPPPLTELSVPSRVTVRDTGAVPVSGRTAPHTTVLVSPPDHRQRAVTSGPDGRFSTTLDLSRSPEGNVDVDLTAVDPSDSATRATRTLEKSTARVAVQDLAVPAQVGLATRAAVPVSATLPGRSALAVRASDGQTTSTAVAPAQDVSGTVRTSLDLRGLAEGTVAVELQPERDEVAGDLTLVTTRLDVTVPELTELQVPATANAQGTRRLEVRGRTEAGSRVEVRVRHQSGHAITETTRTGSTGHFGMAAQAGNLPIGEWTVTVTPTDAAGNVGPASTRTVHALKDSTAYGPSGPAGSSFVPLTPSRLLDTRSGVGVAAGAVAAGATRRLVVTGRGGVPSSGVTAVALNVVAVTPTASTHVTVWPAGTARPGTSSLNLPRGDTRANLVVTAVGSGGAVDLYNAAGSTHLVADVAGYWTTTTTGTSTYVPVSPARLLDTRDGTGAARATVGPGGTVDLAVTGRAGLPSSGVTAVALNVTAVGPSAATHVTVWPTGEPRPGTSNLNAPAGSTRPNAVAAKVGRDGRVSLYNAAGRTHLLADVVGYWTGSAGGARFVPLAPSRLLDTRRDTAVGPGQSLVVTVRGAAVPEDAVGVVLNTTGVTPTADTFLTVWPTGEPRPGTSNLNLPPGLTAAGLVVSGLDSSGRVTVYNNAGSTHVVLDVAGYYTFASAP